MTRRSLFGLIPMPFSAGLSGLLTTKSDVSPAPASDPIARIALEVENDRVVLERLAGFHDRMRRRIPDPRDPGLTHAKVDEYDRGMTEHIMATLNPAEALLREHLGRTPGVSVLINGRVYGTGRRNSQLVMPVWVAMLTPTEGGAR